MFVIVYNVFFCLQLNRLDESLKNKQFEIPVYSFTQSENGNLCVAYTKNWCGHFARPSDLHHDKSRSICVANVNWKSIWEKRDRVR